MLVGQIAPSLHTGPIINIGGSVGGGGESGVWNDTVLSDGSFAVYHFIGWEEFSINGSFTFCHCNGRDVMLMVNVLI